MQDAFLEFPEIKRAFIFSCEAESMLYIRHFIIRARFYSGSDLNLTPRRNGC